MKTIEIPTDINEIKNLSVFSDAIKEINSFQQNLNAFADKIFKDKFVKSGRELLKLIPREKWFEEITLFHSKKELESYNINLIDNLKNKNNIYLKYVNKFIDKDLDSLYDEKSKYEWNNKKFKFIDNVINFFNKDFIFSSDGKFYSYYSPSRTTSMGASSMRNLTFKFSDDGKIMYVLSNWKTKTARFDHIPWIQHNEYMEINLKTNQVKPWKDGTI